MPVLGSSSTTIDALGHLEPRQPLAGELLQLLGVGLLPPAAVTNATGTSPQRSSGAPTTAASDTDVVGRQRLLDLDRGDVLAAGDDHVLEAVAQLDVAVRVHDAEVAGVEPAALERLLGRLLVAVVADHHVVAAHDDLAQRLPVGAARRAISSSTTRSRSLTTVPTPWRARSAACSSPGSSSQSGFQAQTASGP